LLNKWAIPKRAKGKKKKGKGGRNVHSLRVIYILQRAAPVMNWGGRGKREKRGEKREKKNPSTFIPLFRAS